MDINSVKKALASAILAKDTLIMEGAHGIGKSDIVRQFASENGYHLEELFLSNQETGDLIGNMKDIEQDGDLVSMWTKPPWLKRMEMAAKNGMKSILFLDELNRAEPDVRQSALQLVLEGRIHEHSLPIVDGQKTMIVAAINPPGEYDVYELDPALLDRFLHVVVNADLPAFLEYCRRQNVNRVVPDFLIEFPDRLHWTPEDGGRGTSPRSWVKLSHYLDHADQIEPEILYEIMKGKLGKEIAQQFFTYYKNYVKIVKLEDIENLVNSLKDTVDDIDQIGDAIYKLMGEQQPIQKSDMAKRLFDKYIKQDDILVLLAYLYSLELELCFAFLKGIREDYPEEYKKIHSIDDKLNKKKLFYRLMDLSMNAS